MALILNMTLNVLIVILLAVTIAYCWLLNRRIKILQDSRSELAQLLNHFDESTQRASESIIALQTASKKIGENIQFRIDKANYLMDDLSFMIEKGNKLANQMEAGLAVDRARNRVMAEQQPAQPSASGPGYEIEKQPTPQSEKPAAIRDKTSASLEAVLEKVAGRERHEEMSPLERSATRETKPKGARTRSRAEQELLDLIKAGIRG